MTLMIDNRQNIYDTDDIEDLMALVIQKAIEIANIGLECQVSVILVDNKEIQELNRSFRKIDRPTDVLSFPLIEYKRGQYLEQLCKADECEVGDIDIDTKELMLGDIIVSLEKADEQAMEYGHSFEREMAYLTAHGILHLMGYDHESQEEKVLMRCKEEEILSALNIKR